MLLIVVGTKVSNKVEGAVNLDVSNVDWWIEELITLKVVYNIGVEDVVDFSLLVEGAVYVGTKVLFKCVDM